MKRFSLLTLVVAVTLSACSKDSLDYTENSVKPRSEITLQFSFSESSIVHTRVQSTAETALNNLWLFVFNSSGTLEQKSKSRSIKNEVHTADFIIKEGTGLGLYVCANVSAAEEAKFDGLVNGSARVADLKAITSGRSLLNAPGLPMWGESLNQTITAATIKVSMILTRSCSRVDVVASGIADFTLTGIEKLLKTAVVGPIFQGSSLVAAASTTDVVPTNKALGSIYLYENAIVAADEATAENKATAVIVKGSYKGFDGYYKLRVKYNTPAKYDIGRNVVYSINITNVKAPGFVTLAEAEANFPQNVDYTVTASDGDATDLVTSNGQYYLGVTNSEYVAYNSNAMSNEAVVTVTHNAPLSITDGTVTASGVGLTLRTTTIPTSTGKQEIRVDMISYFTSGTLTIRLGNLIKVVTIRKKPSINMGGVLNSDYSAASFVQGDWDENPTWSRFATNNIMNGLDTRRVQNPSGGIWMRFDRNVGLTNTPRSIKGYVTSTDSKGRSRIVVTQESGVLNYVSGVPSLPILSTSTLFVVNVKTDLPGWVIKARDLNMQPFPITLGAKTSPIAGTPSNCYIPVTVASNPGVERTIYLYLCASEDPSIEIYFASLIQQALPPSISISSGGPANIPYTSGVYTTTVTSAYAWNIVDATYNSVITPNTGAAGTTNVSISVPLNSGISQRNIRVVFNTTFGGYTAQTTWTANQLANPYPSDSYIPRNTLIAAGWPSGKLPAIGLQVAVRGNKILPGGTPDMNDMKVQWKTTNTTTSGVDIIIGLSVPNSGLGTGKSGTDAMIAAGVSAHPAAKYCRDMGPEWYFPSVAEVALIYNNSAILGNSYQLGSVFYWCNSQYNTGGGVLWEFGGDLYVNDKVSEWYVRCVRNI